MKEKEGTEKVSKMMMTYNDDKPPNAQENVTGKAMPPPLLGYFPHYWALA